MFIGVAGLIGAGKTTLTERLAKRLGYKTCFEPVDENPYLSDFYKDIARWTFPMQMFLLSQRYQQHLEVIWDPVHRNGGGVVQDRTIYEDTIFARSHHEDGLMDDRDYLTYTNHFNIMKRFLQYPDIILYLRISPEQAMERIRERARDVEKDIDISYIQRLYYGYEEFVEEMDRYTVVLTLDWSEFLPTKEVAERILGGAADNAKFLRSLRRI